MVKKKMTSRKTSESDTTADVEEESNTFYKKMWIELWTEDSRPTSIIVTGWKESFSGVIFYYKIWSGRNVHVNRLETSMVQYYIHCSKKVSTFKYFT